jgi:hypothetical protein
MNTRLFARCLALAAGTLIGAQAMAQYSVELVPQSVCNASGTVVVDLKVTSVDSPNLAVGGQFFLNAAATFRPGSNGGVNITVTGGSNLFFATVNQTTGDINLAYGDSLNNVVIPVNTTIATITLKSTQTLCSTSGLVAFRANVPPTRLSDENANPLAAVTTDLGAITTNDTTGPTFGATPTVNLSANSSCTASSTIAAPSATDNCGAATLGATATLTGATTGTMTVGAPQSFNLGTTTITWTATDACGNSSTTTQSVVVSDTTAPVVTASNVSFSNDAGLCSATKNIVDLASAVDNCPGGLILRAYPTLTGGTLFPFPLSFPAGTTTIYWEAEDASGNVSSPRIAQTITVNDTENPIITAPSAITQNAQAGACFRILSALDVGSPTVADNCAIASTIAYTDAGHTIPFAFPATFNPGVTTIYWRTVDTSGNSATATQIITINPFNTVVASIDLQDVLAAGPITRGITFNFLDSSCNATSVCADINFTAGDGVATFNVPCGATGFTSVTATDAKHTLRRTSSGTGNLTTGGGNYIVDFTASSNKPLIGGNLNNDGFIDILDFGGYIGQVGLPVGADTLCPATGINSDFSGDGLNSSVDFTFIVSNFLVARETDCNGARPGGPRESVTIAELTALGLSSYAHADRNLDFVVDAQDMTLALTVGVNNLCKADFTGDGAPDVQDIFNFLSAWFSNHPRADFNADNASSAQDIFDFLSAWFRGC